jgi:hypothetical protein
MHPGDSGYAIRRVGGHLGQFSGAFHTMTARAIRGTYRRGGNASPSGIVHAKLRLQRGTRRLRLQRGTRRLRLDGSWRCRIPPEANGG